jgi:hypothetical protein
MKSAPHVVGPTCGLFVAAIAGTAAAIAALIASPPAIDATIRALPIALLLSEPNSTRDPANAKLATALDWLR